MGPKTDKTSSSSNGLFRSRFEKSGRRTRPDLRSAMFVLIPIGIIGGAMVHAGSKTISADQAHVSSRYVGISTEVAGPVSDVDVVNNQRVTKGQVLYRLDPRPFEIALDEAETGLLQTTDKLVSQEKSHDPVMGALAIEEAVVQVDRASLDRCALTWNGSEIARQEYDRSRYELQSDLAELSALQRRAHPASAKANAKPGSLVTEQPEYLKAETKLHEAQHALDQTVVRAPFSGTVTDVPPILVGKYLAPYTAAFYLVDTDRVWVDAAPKATDLTRVLPGQIATIHVPTYPALTWYGTVESIGTASFGPRVTGGYSVRIEQPVSMRVRVDTSNPMLPPLAPGMAVKVKVKTDPPRRLPKFVARLFKTPS
jgi:membrane fusion protein (multidrug efflux system)